MVDDVIESLMIAACQQPIQSISLTHFNHHSSFIDHQ